MQLFNYIKNIRLPFEGSSWKGSADIILFISIFDERYIEKAFTGDIVTLKVEGENVMFGRHIFEESTLYSKISRESLDYMKVHCRDQIDNECLQLLMQIKKVFNL